MKRLKTYNKFDLINERYNYVDIMDFTDDQIKKLDEIQEVFNQIPKQDIEECIIDLEDIGYNYTKGVLVSLLWRGGTLNTGKVHTSTGESFTYFTTKDFYKTSNNIFDSDDFKLMNCEIIQSICDTKSESEVERLFANDAIKSHFHGSIIKEIENFDTYIEEGFVHCVTISKLDFLKNWTLNQEKIDVIFELRERVSAICGYDIVFAPPINNPSLVFLDKKYLTKF